MSDKIGLRLGTLQDLKGLKDLYRSAFPEEDLFPLVQSLLEEPDVVLSLVATLDDRLAGHILYTRCSLEPGGHSAALLGPLCAAPDLQKQGVGSRLVQEGLKKLSAWQAGKVLVLGDPAYYGRFGFRPGSRIAPPYALPEEWRDAWQSLDLEAGGVPDAGTLMVPAPWQKRSLWSD